MAPWLGERRTTVLAVGDASLSIPNCTQQGYLILGEESQLAPKIKIEPMEQEAASTILQPSQLLLLGDFPTAFPSFQDFQSLRKEHAWILGLFHGGTSTEVTADTSDTGTPVGWLDCQTRTPFQPFKNLPSVL